MVDARPLWVAALLRALDLAGSGLWATVSWAFQQLRGLSGVTAGLLVLALAVAGFLAARRLQLRLNRLLLAAPERTVSWLDLELRISLPGLAWLPVLLLRRLAASLRRLLTRLRLLRLPATPPAPPPPAVPLLVASLGPSFLLAGLATAGLYALVRLAEPLVGARLGLSPGVGAWTYLLLGGRPELGPFLPLERLPFLAGLSAVALWLAVGWWAGRLVRLVYRRPLGSNRFEDRNDGAVLPLWRRWAGVSSLVRPDASYLVWARWLVAAAVPLLVWAWFSLDGAPFRVGASELAVAFVVWLFWAIHLDLAGLVRVPEGEPASATGSEAKAAGWPEVLAWLGEHHQAAAPREHDVPRAVEPRQWTDIPAALDAVISPLVLDLLAPPRRLTAMQRVLLRDLSLSAWVHVEPPPSHDQLELGDVGDAAGEAVEDRSNLRRRHQIVIAPEAAGKSTLALLAAANHALVHTRSTLVVTRDDAAEDRLHQCFRAAIDPTTLRWNVRVRRAGTDLMNDLSQGIVPDVVVCSLARLTVDVLGNFATFHRFFETLGLIVVDDVESFAGPVEVHAQLALRRLAGRVCSLLGVRDLDRQGAPQVLVLASDTMDDLPAWARALCGIDAVTRDFTRSRAETAEREMAELLAHGLSGPPESTAAGQDGDPLSRLAAVRQGRHQVFYRLRDFRTADREPLGATDVVAACEQLAVPWHYRPCGDGRRPFGRMPLLLRDEPRHHVDSAEEACVVFLDGSWAEVRRERRRLCRAGARFSRRRTAGDLGTERAAGADEPEPIAVLSLVDPDEEMAFTQLDRRFGLKEVLDRLPYPILCSPTDEARQAHLAADLVQHWLEVREILDVFGPAAAPTLVRLSRAEVLLTDPLFDVHPEAPRYERKLQVRALARSTPPPEATPAEAAVAPLPAPVGDVEVVTPAAVAVRDRIRGLLLGRVDAAAADILYYPGRIFHDARGSYVVVDRTLGPATGEAGTADIEVEPLLADDLTSPRRRVHVLRPAPGPIAVIPPPAAGPGEPTAAPAEAGAGPEPLLLGDLPLGRALLAVELSCEHIATYRLGPVRRELRQRQLQGAAEHERTRRSGLATWALALFPNPAAAAGRPGPALTLGPARLVAAAVRAVLPSLLRGASERLEVALRVDLPQPAAEHVLGPWEGFYLFDLAQGGNGTARALHRDKIEELLRLCRLLLERVLDPSRLLAVHDHWGDEEEILAAGGAGGFDDGGGERWQAARREALIWLDSRLRPEGRSARADTLAGRFLAGFQAGEGDVQDIGRCWYSRQGEVSDLLWMKHRWRLPSGGDAMLDVGFDQETAVAARWFAGDAGRLASYREAYEALLADSACRLADGTAGVAPREAWTAGPGASAVACREGLTAEPLPGYCALAWSIAHHGHAPLAPLAEVLRAGAPPEGGRRALATTLARFVQDIPYSLPAALRGGLRPPVSTLLYRLGDCDSKSLLLALLAWHCGLPAGLFLSFTDGHALAAVALPDPLPAPSDPPAPAGAEQPAESPARAHLTAWSAAAGLPAPPALWGELALPGEGGVQMFVPVESTADLPVGFARVEHPRTWVFLPLLELDCELPTGEDGDLSPADQAEHESRS
jgi:hypothetical protein